MNDNLNNTPSERLTLYMDGELGPAEQAELEAVIDDDAALQSEMSEMSSIREAARRDAESLLPPSESKDHVFAAIGIGAGVLAEPIRTAAGPLSRMLAPALTVIGVAVLSLAGYLAFRGDDKPATAAVNNSAPASYEEAAVQESVPVAAAAERNGGTANPSGNAGGRSWHETMPPRQRSLVVMPVADVSEMPAGGTDGTSGVSIPAEQNGGDSRSALLYEASRYERNAYEDFANGIEKQNVFLADSYGKKDMPANRYTPFPWGAYISGSSFTSAQALSVDKFEIAGTFSEVQDALFKAGYVNMRFFDADGAGQSTGGPVIGAMYRISPLRIAGAVTPFAGMNLAWIMSGDYNMMISPTAGVSIPFSLIRNGEIFMGYEINRLINDNGSPLDKNSFFIGVSTAF